MKEFKELDEAFEFLESIFNGKSSILDQVSVPRFFSPESSFPPVNIFVEKDTNNMVFEFAVAGVEEGRISIDFKNDYMLFEIAEKKEEAQADTRKYLARGIRSSTVKSKYLVPSSKYKHDEASAVLKEGILKVTVPAVPEAEPKKISIIKQ